MATAGRRKNCARTLTADGRRCGLDMTYRVVVVVGCGGGGAVVAAAAAVVVGTMAGNGGEYR